MDIFAAEFHAGVAIRESARIGFAIFMFILLAWPFLDRKR